MAIATATIPTVSVEDLIIHEVETTKGGWGAILNRIQDAAEAALPKRNFQAYLDKAERDANASEGIDGVLLNGQYFDWREFEPKRLQIVRAYMRYFSAGELNMIHSQLKLKTRRKR